ncbi:hypothetical protein KQI68_07390 [Peptoniphilus sp. MSJ-1]|uniref:YOMG-like N-terminal domain-containing protein n=1 Tax=Peptoniphilus ovalis TaxID=2841503 RepID=A0ABS6FHZ2_9FIRM|nr:hypothetical protein [Peptoniphilus ovalis]MBU5669663.1 hypothetical protein [Peptoniphilus ovalis]
MDIAINGVDFNKKIRLHLCKPDRKPFMEIHNIKELRRKISIVGVDEISFSIPLYRPDFKGKRVRNELFDKVVGDYYIYLNDGKDDENGQYFIIQSPEEKKSSSGEAYKYVTAYSAEYVFSTKKVGDFDRESRLLYDPNYQKDKDGYDMGFLNYVESRTSWRVEYVDPKVQVKYRELKFSNTSFLDAFKVCQDKYNCLFQYNTAKETIRVVNASSESNVLGGNKGIVISDNNFISSITKKINTDDIVTRLFMYGDDTISFQNHNILGLSYVEDISFYKDFNYLSDSLTKALNKYEKAVEELTPNFKTIVKNLDNISNESARLLTQRVEKQNEVDKLKHLVDQNISNIAINVERYNSIESINEDLRRKISDSQNKQHQAEKQVVDLSNRFNSKLKELEAENDKLMELRKKLDKTKFFSTDDLREYEKYIKEGIVQDSSFKRTDEANLYEYAKDELNRLCYPSISFDIDLDDFRDMAQFETPMARLQTGDLINLESDDLDIKFEARLLEMELNYDKEGITLIFGNKFSTTDPTMYLSDLIGRIQSASNQVALRNSEWNKSIEKYSSIAKRLDSDLDLSKQAIVSAKNQKPILDERGLWLIKENPDGTIDNKQVRGINNVIAFTDDNWETVKTAITGDGINAEVIRGRLGEFVTVNANQIIVNESGDISPLERIMNELNERTKKELNGEISSSKTDLNRKIDDSKAELSGKINTNKTELSDKIVANKTELSKAVNETKQRLDDEVRRLEAFAKDYVAKYGGKTYRQRSEPTDTDISDGALWMKIDTANKLVGVYRYNGNLKRWQELDDLILKNSSYGGAKLTDDGLVTTSNGVKINKEGVVVSNISDTGTKVTSVMNAYGFFINAEKGGEKSTVFYVDKEGNLSLTAPFTNETIRMNSNGISLPATSKLEIGTNPDSFNYIRINSNGVIFGKNGFEYDTNSGKLKIGGNSGLVWDGRELTISGIPVANMKEIIEIKDKLRYLADQLNNGRMPAYVQFG